MNDGEPLPHAYKSVYFTLTHRKDAILCYDSADVARPGNRVFGLLFGLLLQNRPNVVDIAYKVTESHLGVGLDDSVEGKLFEEALGGPVRS